MRRLKLLVLGLGSIGKRHARLLRQHFPHEVCALRTRLGQEPDDSGIPVLSSWEEVTPGRFDVALIANPTFRHLETAQLCAERGLHLFLEKPIDCRTEGLDALLQTVQERHLTSYLAYPLRFHPAVAGLRRWLSGRSFLHANMTCASYLPEWRPHQDYRLGHAVHRSRGGGVLLEMSHELDLADWLFGPVLQLEGRLHWLSDLSTDAEDSADLILRHERGATSVHLNYFSRRRRRVIEVECADGFAAADLVRSQLSITDAAGTRMEDYPFEVDAMYLDQLRYFLERVGRTDLDNSLPQAARLFARIIAFREAQYHEHSDHHLRPGRLPGS